jgi:acyl-CoA thioester hydrolase
MKPLFEKQFSVLFYETDAAGFVHFSNYFRWMETLEAAFLNSIGVPSYETLSDGFSGFPKRKCTCEYNKSLYFGDVVDARLFVEKCGNTSLSWRCEFVRNDELCSVGHWTVVHVKGTPPQPTPLPAVLKQIAQAHALKH